MTFRFASGILWLFLLLSAQLLALEQESGVAAPFSPERLEFELRFLASDELGGRKTGTSGAETAARFIAESFRAAGAEPVPGQETFLQPISFEQTTPPDALAVTVGRESFQESRIAWLGGSGEIEGPAHVSEAWNSDLEGKIWFSPLSLQGGPSQLQVRLERKLEQASTGGALALIHVYSGEGGWAQLRAFLTRTRLQLGRADEPEIPHLMLASPDPVAGTPVDASVRVGFPDVENFTSSNVAGIIKGTHSELRKEYIALVAHYDHLGRTEAADRPSSGEDLVFNGARDNGMGIVALLGTARALQQSRPHRSILLLAVTGEEQGLLGSQYFVENPLVPLDTIRFVLNADGAGFTATDVVTVIGFDRTNGKEALERAASDFGLEAIREPEEAASLFTRSDNYSFARKGIPAVTFSPGFRQMDQNLMKHYHQRSDEADDNFDYDYLVKFVQIFSRSARYLADSENTWSWTEGDPFEETARTLYGLP